MTIPILFDRITRILNQSIELLIGVAVVVFFWGIIQYVIAQGDAKKLEDGRKYMLYGIIGISVIVSTWGIVNIIMFTLFGTEASNPFFFEIPQIQ